MRTTPRWMVAATAIVILATLAASCSSDGGEGSEGGASGAGGLTVTMKDLAFVPFMLMVTAGQDTTIQLVNQDGVEHSFTLDDRSVSQVVEGAESSSITINVSEMTGWHCEFHTDMRGTIHVE